ncbi:MAG: hypothetical protein OXP66_19450 [Candidatus Tectomicrobia bacterium]|nr:hypothetical protein [Candidatus Tectomicrobia bacterium]
MDDRRATAIQVLEQVIKALRELSDADIDGLMRGELEASVSFVRPAAGNRERRQAGAPVADAAFREVQARLSAAASREEGQRIVEESFAGKEQLFGFAKWLDLPVQRSDAAKRIREKVVTHTVGRRLSGRAVRGGTGGNASGDGD